MIMLIPLELLQPSYSFCNALTITLCDLHWNEELRLREGEISSAWKEGDPIRGCGKTML
jgi:hypothetical protein